MDMGCPETQSMAGLPGRIDDSSRIGASSQASTTRAELVASPPDHPPSVLVAAPPPIHGVPCPGEPEPALTSTVGPSGSPPAPPQAGGKRPAPAAPPAEPPPAAPLGGRAYTVPQALSEALSAENLRALPQAHGGPDVLRVTPAATHTHTHAHAPTHAGKRVPASFKEFCQEQRPLLPEGLRHTEKQVASPRPPSQPQG